MDEKIAKTGDLKVDMSTREPGHWKVQDPTTSPILLLVVVD
jgi:hypothetical protein